MKLRVDLVDNAVLRAIGGDVLSPAGVGAVLDGVFEVLQTDARGAPLKQLRAELARVEKVGRLSEAIAIGVDLTSLLDVLKARQAHQDGLRRAIGVEARYPQVPESIGARGGTGSRTPGPLAPHADSAGRDARQLLRETLTSPIRFTPVDRVYQFAGGSCRLVRCWPGTVVLPTNVAPARAFAKECFPENVELSGIAA